jgi:hypothetical protein
MQICGNFNLNSGVFNIVSFRRRILVWWDMQPTILLIEPPAPAAQVKHLYRIPQGSTTVWAKWRLFRTKNKPHFYNKFKY